MVDVAYTLRTLEFILCKFLIKLRLKDTHHSSEWLRALFIIMICNYQIA